MGHDPTETLRQKRSAVKDRVRAVVSGTGRGLYLRGRPGPAKQHLVEKTLNECEKDYEWCRAPIDQEDLFRIFCRDKHQCRTDVIVLCDAAALLADPRSVEILMASLEAPQVLPDSESPYSAVWGQKEIVSSASIIAIGEIPEDCDAPTILSDLNRRFEIAEYEPTDRELECFYSSRDTDWLQHAYGYWHGMDRDAEAELRLRGLTGVQLGKILFGTQTPMRAISKYRLACGMHPSWTPPRTVLEEFLLASEVSPELAVAVACYVVLLKKERWKDAEHLLLRYENIFGRDHDPYVREYLEKYM